MPLQRSGLSHSLHDIADRPDAARREPHGDGALPEPRRKRRGVTLGGDAQALAAARLERAVATFELAVPSAAPARVAAEPRSRPSQQGARQTQEPELATRPFVPPRAPAERVIPDRLEKDVADDLFAALSTAAEAPTDPPRDAAPEAPAAANATPQRKEPPAAHEAHGAQGDGAQDPGLSRRAAAEGIDAERPARAKNPGAAAASPARPYRRPAPGAARPAPLSSSPRAAAAAPAAAPLRPASPLRLPLAPQTAALHEGRTGDALDLAGLLAVLWHGRRIIVAAITVFVVAASFFIAHMSPSYRAAGTVLFDEHRFGERAAAPRTGLREEIEILSSTRLLERVATTLDLGREDEFGRFAAVPGFSLFDWRAIASADPRESARRHTRAVVSRLRQNLRLQPVEGSRVVEIAYEARDPALAARVVNALAEAYVVEEMEATLEATHKASAWLTERSEHLAGEVRRAELALETARGALDAAAGGSLESARRQLTRLSGELASARAARARLEVQSAVAERTLSDPAADPGAVSLFRNAPSIARLRDRQGTLLGEDATFRAVAAKSPRRVAIAAELKETDRAIRREAEGVAVSLRSDLEAAREGEARLEAEIAALERAEETQRKGTVDLRQLEREVEASRALYETYLARLKETSQNAAARDQGLRVLSPAEPPAAPQASHKGRLLLIALVLGAGFGAGAVIVRERLGDTARCAAEIETATGLAVLASLPLSQEADAGPQTVRPQDPGADDEMLQDRPQSAPQGPLAQAVREMRTSILFGLEGSAPKVVAFTASHGSEGTSTSARLFARASRRMGLSVLLLDCDLRNPRPPGSDGEADAVREGESGNGPDDAGPESGRPGLVAVLHGRAALNDAIAADPSGLDRLTVGDREALSAAQGADIVSSVAFSQLLGSLCERYDLVVIDTPPVLELAHARILARLADALVYVVRANRTACADVNEGVRALLRVRAPVLGLVLTMAGSAAPARLTLPGHGPSNGKESGGRSGRSATS